MPRAKRFSELRRQLIRRLPHVSDGDVESLRDQLWDVLIARVFMGGRSVEQSAATQPSRNTTESIEFAIRRQMRRQRSR